MGFAGVFAASIGVVVVTLAANGRWPAVWSALTGGAAQPATPPPAQSGFQNDAGQSSSQSSAGTWGTPSGPQP